MAPPHELQLIGGAHPSMHAFRSSRSLCEEAAAARQEPAAHEDFRQLGPPAGGRGSM